MAMIPGMLGSAKHLSPKRLLPLSAGRTSAFPRGFLSASQGARWDDLVERTWTPAQHRNLAPMHSGYKVKLIVVCRYQCCSCAHAKSCRIPYLVRLLTARTCCFPYRTSQLVSYFCFICIQDLGFNHCWTRPAKHSTSRLHFHISSFA